MAANPKKQLELFKAYISARKIVIADSSSASRTGLARTFADFGAKSTNIKLASTYEAAIEEIGKLKPHIVVCDYDLGKRCGLDLLQEQRKNDLNSKECLFVLVTGNTSQSAVAQAAEEDVDTFILKPYTIEQMRNSIMKAALLKVHPSDYQKKVEEGKKLLFDAKADEAMKVFAEAMTMDPKPALACYYHGQAELLKKLTDKADKSYKKGLGFNKIHYKCLVGMFELLMDQKKNKDAYEIVKKISRYFPANPQRLTQVLRLAVMTQSYDDMERYYQVFTNIDARNEELIKYVCAALVVTGKFYLKRNLGTRALELFTKAAATASGRTRILREIVISLVDNDLIKDAEEFLTKFPPNTHKSVDYLSVKFMVGDKVLGPGPLIDQGRKLISEEVNDPIVYDIMIRRTLEVGQKDQAEQYVQKAAQKWPNQKAKFEKVFQSNLALAEKAKAEKAEAAKKAAAA